MVIPHRHLVWQVVLPCGYDRGQCFGRSTAGSRALAWRRGCAWLRVNGKERRLTMLAVCLVLGLGIPTCCEPTQIYALLTMCGAVYAAWWGWGALVALLGPHAIWRLVSLAPKSHQQRLVRGGGAEQLSGRGLVGTRGIDKRTSTDYGHASAPCAPFSPTLPAGARRRFRQKNGASTKKALFYPSSAPSGVAPTTRIVISQKY